MGIYAAPSPLRTVPTPPTRKRKTANVLFGTHMLLKHETKKRTQNKIERKQNKRKEKNRKEKKREENKIFL